MLSRRAALVATALLLAGLTGCAGTSAATPTPTPTGFASEEEAFAAAEETYELYNAATNAIRLDDPATFDGVLDLTVGDFNAHQRETLSQMHAAGWTVKGETRYEGLDPQSFDRATQSVVIEVCVDVSRVEVLDVAGESVVSENRAERQAASIVLQPAHTSTGLALAHSERVEDPECGP
jgi:hypothetical protein